jgi:hypothetical protein
VEDPLPAIIAKGKRERFGDLARVRGCRGGPRRSKCGRFDLLDERADQAKQLGMLGSMSVSHQKVTNLDP